MRFSSPRTLALAALALVLATGCSARRRVPGAMPKQPGSYTPPIASPAADLSAMVSDVVRQERYGTGGADAVVVGNVALVAMDSAALGLGPGGGRGPIGAPGEPPAARGGHTAGGLTTRGTLPSQSPGAPGNTSPLVAGGGADAAGPPGQRGTTLDNMTRLSDRIRNALPQIVEVRFVTDPGPAARLRAIAAELRRGRPVTPHVAELATLFGQSFEAGTVHMPGGPPARGHAPGPGSTSTPQSTRPSGTP